MTDGITAAAREAEWDSAYERLIAGIALHLLGKVDEQALDGLVDALDSIRVPHGGRPDYKSRTPRILAGLRRGDVGEWVRFSIIGESTFLYGDLFDGVIELPKGFEEATAYRRELWRALWALSPWTKPVLILRRDDGNNLRALGELVLASVPKSARFAVVDPERLGQAVVEHS